MNNFIKAGIGLLTLSWLLGQRKKAEPEKPVEKVDAEEVFVGGLPSWQRRNRGGLTDAQIRRDLKLVPMLEQWFRTCQVCGGVFTDKLTDRIPKRGLVCPTCYRNWNKFGIIYKD